ncbi:MAG: ISKra4 family transposase [bacterium]|nr:ISKra4 family transposase [bacterium]
MIVLEIPEEVNAVAPALLAMLETLRKQVERGRIGASVDIADFEQLLADKMNAVERAALGIALGALAVDFPMVLIDGVLHTRVLRSKTKFMGLAGPTVVMRSLYRPAGVRNAPVVDPVAIRAGALEGVWLPATAREIAYLVQQGTSREAATMGERLRRLPYSHSAFQHIAHAVGHRYVDQHQQIEQQLIEVFEVPEQARSISVSLDRVSVPMEEPRDRPVGRPRKGAPKRPISRVFRMAYCGTVTLHDGEGKGIHTIRYGTMPAGDPVALCTGMADDVIELLGQQPDLRVQLLCDGAKDMWNLLDAEFTTSPFDKREILVSRLIDFWHAVEKLAPAAKVLFDEDSDAQLARWKLRLKTRSNANAEILAELIESDLEHVRVGDDEPVHQAITYFTNHQDRMDYASARRAGLPIGSGAVEATCKSLIAMRMKRPGARWKTRTGEHIVHLRALALSDRWDAAMDLALPSARVKIRRAA